MQLMEQAVAVIVHHDGQGAIGLTFPDFPGCFSAADRLEDLASQAAEALALWLDVPAAEVRLPGGFALSPEAGSEGGQRIVLTAVLPG